MASLPRSSRLISPLLAFAPALLFLLLAGCRPPEEQPQQQPAATPVERTGIPLPPELVESTGLAVTDQRAGIVLLLHDARLPLQDYQRAGLSMLVGRQKGYKLTSQDAAGSLARQMEQFRAAIAAKPAAIFVSPVDPAALAALIVEATTAGITVIGLDKRMVSEGCASVVYCDQKRVGGLAAETVLDALRRKAAEENRAEVAGRVVQIRGADDSIPANDLAEGFTDGLRKEPGVVLVHDAPADWLPENAALRTAEAFRLQKQFDVIFAHNDALALGAAKAATDAGQRDNIFIIGTDGMPGPQKGLELVREGDLDATIVQPALVDLALQILLKLRADKNFKPQPAYEITPVAVVPKNVEQRLRVGTYSLPAL